MHSTHRPLVLIWSAVLVLAATVVLMTVFWRGGQSKSAHSGVSPMEEKAGVIPHIAAGAGEKKPEDFSHLPPAERINAETKARMERSATWREKLRSGNYSTLPPEAYPSGVPPVQTPKSP